jgi:hypothetical protein
MTRAIVAVAGMLGALAACSSGSGASSTTPPGEDGGAGADGACCADAGSERSGDDGGGVTDAPSSADGSPDSGAPGDSTGVVAVSANVFLASLGVNTHIDQGFDPTQYVMPLQYLGVRNIRDGERNLASTITVHQQTGVLVNVTAGGDVTGLLAAGRQLAAAGALLSLEGPNEPNNFPITYDGQMGGGTGTWVPVAQAQRDLYAGVKGDATLSKYPVLSVSEDGAETDDVGLQFLVIPAGSGIAMPDGTKYADYANPHNYVIGNAGTYNDNQAWQAADPTLNGGVGGWDGLYGEYGVTWAKQYQGYSSAELQTLPRVTTETGWDSVDNPGGEHVQGVVLVNTYLAQFKRGWTYTFVYELVDEQGSTGDQGLYHTDFTPKLSATYIHDLTSILADTKTLPSPGRLDYAIENEPATVHDLLLQKSSGSFELVVWDERASATDAVTVSLGKTRSTVNLYDVTTGTTPTMKLTNVASVPLTLSDHAVVIEVIE